MTILTATEDGAVDDTARDVHDSMAYVRALVEVYTLVALTGTEEVAGHRVSCNLRQRTRHTQRTTRHRDVSSTGNIRHLITAIYVCQDMTAADIHVCVTLNQAGRHEPFIFFTAQRISEVTGATTKDVTIECMTVRASCTVSFSISFSIITTLARMFIVRQPLHSA